LDGSVAKVRPAQTSRRLAKGDRRRQLLDAALRIVREEGADRLTLGHLAIRAGVSKPVAYDHFETRSALLIALYRWIDTERIDAFRNAMAQGERSADETVQRLAQAYIQCAADIDGEFHAVGAALAGSEEKAAVFQELLGRCVDMFVELLTPHCAVPPKEMRRRCIGLVGAGEALAAARLRGDCSEAEAIETFEALINGAVAGRSLLP
jgi:AcrR family transcriptional regulator